MPPSASPTAPYSLRQAAFAQLAGVLAAGVLIFGLARNGRSDIADIALLLAMLQGCVAAAMALKQGAPFWWLIIHLGFAPLLLVVHALDIAPGWFLAGFLVLFVTFWRTDRGRIPLYLTNRATANALLELLPRRPSQIADLGCGDGRLLSLWAKARPDCHFTGIEHAPLPWLIARLRALSLPNATIRRADFWREPLGKYDLVYAFLSPVPMPRLWEKAAAEMRSDAMLVSNSFAVPDVVPDACIAVRDRRATRLYLYRPNKARDSAAFPAIPRIDDQE